MRKRGTLTSKHEHGGPDFTTKSDQESSSSSASKEKGIFGWSVRLQDLHCLRFQRKGLHHDTCFIFFFCLHSHPPRELDVLLLHWQLNISLLPQKKKSALFEVAEVVPVMTNNYEENILRGVSDSSYSLESSIELLQKDVVQLHAPRYQSMRRVSDWGRIQVLLWRRRTCGLKLCFPCVLLQDVIGCTQEMDFILWPRNDIEKIVCLLFSRWKGADDVPFRPVQVCDWHSNASCQHVLKHTALTKKNNTQCLATQQAKFEFHHGDYEKQCLHALGRKDKAGMVMNNPNQSVFLFMDRQHLQVSPWLIPSLNWVNQQQSWTAGKTPNHNMHCASLQTPKTKATVFKLCSLCLYLPQDQLTSWGVGDIEDHLRPYMPD